MKQRNKFCITFAGAVGSSKSPIAVHLSYTFNLPIFQHDVIRSEVAEDLLGFDQNEYEKRKNERGEAVLAKGNSFIYDISVDRSWGTLREKLLENKYEIFVISLDLSKELLEKLYKAKGYLESLERIDQIYADHEKFLEKHKAAVNLHIDDASFHQRLQLSEDALREWSA